MHRLLLLVWLLASQLGNAAGTLESAELGKPLVPLGRLPDGVRPEHYNLVLKLDPTRELFEGEADIRVVLSQASDRIFLHGRGLEVSEVVARTNEGDLLGSYRQVDVGGVAEVRFPLALEAGEAELRFRYRARYSLKLEGLYKVIDQGRPYLFTQFESIFARQMFPSFDEPGFKTPFAVTLEIPSSMEAIFNTPEVHRQEIAGIKRIRYQRTQALPTYLLALVVGDIDIVNAKPIAPNDIRKTELALRGVATKGKGKLMGYALENTAPILEALERYFGTPYPFEKLDLIAVPDFASGAMENAGAITYREQLLLIKDDAPLSQKVAYTGTHTHELAHQWFGNLVTPTWWDDIWLNEAFATWMAAKIAGEVRPQFNFQHRIQSGAIVAMELDGLKSARQVRNPVTNNHEIVGAFDAITYRKGGGVLQMFEAYLGEERFKQGVRHYLKRHAGGNASARDFLRALGEAANDPQVAPAFESFLTQNGVPVIALEHSCKRGKLDITLSQSRFLARSLRPGQSAPQHWQVPLCLKFEGSKQIECVRLDQPEQAFEFQLTRCPRFVFPNAEGRAYVRLQFTPAQWRQMIKRQQQLSSAEVLAMVDGLSAGVMSGQLNAKQYLDLMRRIVDAGASDALLSSMTTTRFVYDYLMDQRTQRSARWLYAPLMRTLGLSANSKLDQSNPGLASELRTRALELSLAFGDDKTERTLAVLGARYLGLEGEAESDAVSAEVREFALAAAARAHGAPAVALIQQRLFESTDAVLRLQLLRALGWVDDVVLADELRNFALDERLRGNEVMPLLLTQAARPATRTQLWEWLKANVETLRGRLGEKSQAQILELTAGLCSGEQQKQVRQLFEPMVTSISNGPRALAVALERIDRCAALRRSEKR